jgi:hypothetical protein
MKIAFNENDDEATILLKTSVVHKLHIFRHKKEVDEPDLDFFITRIAHKKAEYALEHFDKLLDPWEMYYMNENGIPNRIWAKMVWYHPPEFINVISDVCSAFCFFSDWHFARTLASDWTDRRQEIEEANEFRKLLLKHIAFTLETHIDRETGRKIFEWSCERARENWKLIRWYAILRNTAFFWFEKSQQRHYSETGYKKSLDLMLFAKEFFD